MNCLVRTIHFVIIVLLFCAITLEANTKDKESKDKLLFNQQHGQVSSQNVEFTFPQRKWISQLFFNAQMAFQMDSIVNTECKKDFDLFKLHLQNQSLWAVKMMESSEWPLGDILSGAVDYMGDYDECLSISSYGIKGQYCLTEVVYDYPDTFINNKAENISDEFISAWEALNIYQKNPQIMDRKMLRFAMCIPSSCKPVDLKLSLNSILNPIFKTHGLEISIDVKPIFCKIHEEFTYHLGYYFVGFSFVALFLFVLGCTFFDTFNEVETKLIAKPKNYSLSDVWNIFSITRNFQKLKKFDPECDQAGLHFLKFGTMLATIHVHRLYYIGGFPTFNTIVAERLTYHFPILMVHSCFIVDPFFMISGFLKFHLDLLPMTERGKVFLFSSILSRWIRMVPVFGVLLLFVINILPYFGDGPIWDYAITNEVTNSKESWWTSFLAINNIVKANKMCLIIGWYVTVDIQLSIIGGILLYIFAKNRKTGIIAAILSFVIFAIVTFIICYVKEYSGITKFSVNTMKKDFRNDEEFTHFYTSTFPRCGPYLIGFLSAYVVKILKEKNFKFTKIQIYSLLLISLLVTEISQFYGARYYDLNRQYDRFENALYAAVNRSLYVVVFAVTVILYYSSGLGIFQRFVDAKIWIPLGRLTYSVFLINTLPQLYFAACLKKPVSLPNMTYVYWWTFGDIILSYTIALFLHLFVEAPIISLKKLIHRQLLRKYNSNEITSVEDHSSNDTNAEITKCKKTH